mmetsp:Transcript_1249/g.2703  ORF Transcript_1249/g.2703 Transcript_1249/m.2703 type:complete len:230 (+) Transcript_1249:188-877(+)
MFIRRKSGPIRGRRMLSVTICHGAIQLNLNPGEEGSLVDARFDFTSSHSSSSLDATGKVGGLLLLASNLGLETSSNMRNSCLRISSSSPSLQALISSGWNVDSKIQSETRSARAIFGNLPQPRFSAVLRLSGCLRIEAANTLQRFAEFILFVLLHLTTSRRKRSTVQRISILVSESEQSSLRNVESICCTLAELEIASIRSSKIWGVISGGSRSIRVRFIAPATVCTSS